MRYEVWHCPNCHLYPYYRSRCPIDLMRLHPIDVTKVIEDIIAHYSEPEVKAKRNTYAKMLEEYGRYVSMGIINPEEIPKSGIETLLAIYDTALWTVKVRWWRRR